MLFTDQLAGLAMGAIGATSTNGTSGSGTSTFILDQYVPGFGFVSQKIHNSTGIDAGIWVAACIFIYGSFTQLLKLYQKLQEEYFQYFMAIVQIDQCDDLYREVMDWMSTQDMTKVSRSLKVSTRNRSEYHPEVQDAG